MSLLAWPLARATGVLALVVLTVVVVLGIAVNRRLHLSPRARFATTMVHRSAALMGVALVGVHLAALLADSYVDIRLVDLVVPFTASYRPFWTGLGAIGVDLLALVTVTSLVRDRLPARAWKGVHLLAYAFWPIALAHGLGAGTDASQRWFLVIAIACAATVVGAVVVRLLPTPSEPDHRPEPATARTKEFA